MGSKDCRNFIRMNLKDDRKEEVYAGDQIHLP